MEIRFMELLKQYAPKHAQQEERYPRNQEEPPVYTRFPIPYRYDDMTPSHEVKAYKFVLTCPICASEVKRSYTFCTTCGNKLQ